MTTYYVIRSTRTLNPRACFFSLKDAQAYVAGINNPFLSIYISYFKKGV